MKKILYLECKSGAAGDMIMAALYSLLSDADKKIFIKKMNSLHPLISVEPVPEKRSGISGMRMKVLINGESEEKASDTGRASDPHHPDEGAGQKEHSHSADAPRRDCEEEDSHQHSHDDDGGHASSGTQRPHSHITAAKVFEELEGMSLPAKVRENAKAVYRIIADAESRVHGEEIEQIHFHEVGTLDALADVAGCCLAAEMTGADEIECSPLCLGNGSVECAHGVLPVPAPATAEIIKGIPSYCSEDDGEMLTPTGAAVIKQLAGRFTKKLDMEILDVGYGFGTRYFGRLTCVRAFLGLREDEDAGNSPADRVCGGREELPAAEDPDGAQARVKSVFSEGKGTETCLTAEDCTDKDTQKAEKALEDEAGTDPWVDRFLDAESFEDKYEVVCAIKGDITDKLIDDIAVIMDIVIPEGSLMDRYEQLKACINTRLKYENKRLRKM